MKRAAKKAIPAPNAVAPFTSSKPSAKRGLEIKTNLRAGGTTFDRGPRGRGVVFR